MSRLFTTTCLLLNAFMLTAQSSEPPADFLRSVGKLYVVVAVIVVVFLGIVLYLWSADRRLTKLETHIEDHV